MVVFNMFIVMLSKILIVLLKFLGKKAGAFPGEIALRLNKNIRDYIKVDGKIIVITGTNGKTTTTNMIYEILKDSGKKVICNIAGNNIDSGITTILLKECNLFGKINADYLVLETDEYWLPVVFSKPNLNIDTLIVLNFFRDQLDRAGEMECVISNLEQYISKYFKGNIILNSNDPNVVRLGLKVPEKRRFYYGIDKLKSSYKTSTDKMEGIICPFCDTLLKYDFYQYSHIGKFCCPTCDYGNLKNYLEISKIKDDYFYIGKDRYKVSNTNLYHIYNLLAIIVLCDIYDFDKKKMKDIFKNYKSKNGRQQKFKINGKDCLLNLGKNPAGFNMLLKQVSNDKSKKELLILINDMPSDGEDISWIWDIDFSSIKLFDRIICGGTRAYDMAIVIKNNNYDINKIVVEKSIEKSLTKLFETNNKKYIISNYSPVTKTKDILEKMENGDKR